MEILDPKNFIGFAPIQVADFLKSEVYPILEKNKELLGMNTDLKV